MVRSTPKTTEAVPLPKDGPILLHLNNNETDEVAVNDLIGIKESLELLSVARCNVEESKAAESSPSQMLCNILTNSDQIRPQLQALQAHRSRLIHLDKIGEIENHDELVGTYRLLLEWYLSNDIPTPLRRAIFSNLNTLDSIIGEQASTVRNQMISSLLEEQQCWSDPLGSLFELLNYEPICSIIVKDDEMSVKTCALLVKEADSLRPLLEDQSFHNRANSANPPSVTSRTVVASMEKCAFLANSLKLFLTPILSCMREATADLVSLMETLQKFLWSALTCRGMPADELNVIGVTYGQALLFQWKYESEGDSVSLLIADKAVAKANAVTTDRLLPQLNKLAIVKGITATLPNEVLVLQSPPVFSEPLAAHLLEQCQTATGAAVRLSSLRALHTLVNRCLTIMSTPLVEECHLSYIYELYNATLEVALQAWESPPARQVATAVPGLFRACISLMQKCSVLNGAPTSSLKDLVQRILDLPPNRKGKYLALESLLPQVGASFLIEVAGEDIIVSLITRISDGGHHAVALSDLLGELLSRLRVEMNGQAGLVAPKTSLSKKEQRKRDKKIAQGEIVNNTSPSNELPFLPEWVALWVPHLAFALVTGSKSQRRHISARCLPLFVQIVGGSPRRQDAAYGFSFLLEEVQAQRSRATSIGEQVQSYSCDTETTSDRILWASFEIAKQASLQKLVGSSYSSNPLASAVATAIPHDVLESSLTHSSQSIRLIAFASIEPVVRTYYSTEVSSLLLIEKEISYWRSALPYSCKAGSKEFNKELLLILSSLLNRLSDVESACYEGCLDNDTTCETRHTATDHLPLLTSFVRDFLIEEVLVRQGAYPGTVADKEGFVLALFDCILSFVSQDGTACSLAQPIRKSGGHCRKSPRAIEVKTMRHILACLLDNEPMSALFSLLYSIWDNTRASAFGRLCTLIQLAHARDLRFPNRFSSPESLRYIQARAVYLASSPRQREADTGSRILAFIGNLLLIQQERRTHIVQLLALLSDRLGMMADVLGIVSNNSMNSAVRPPTSTLLGDGTKMPMCHGLMMALRFAVEDKSFLLGKNDPFYESFIVVCCRAVQLSLSVVADLKEGASLADEDFPTEVETSCSNGTPLNVNTGAIGANAGFSSVQGEDIAAAVHRFAFQRVIMAAWLMTKEACASLASTITCTEFDPSLRSVERVGSILISTLTALKHQGAAFAAHRALQEVVEFCFSTSVDEAFANLPLLWAKRLMSDISGSGKVRDSTLRRSTGFALAFLSIMRSEPPSGVTPRVLCPDILATLVRLSLPPKDDLEKHMKQLGFTQGSKESLHSTSAVISSQFELTTDDEFSDKCRVRVHALNILRLAILDAPLASDTRPFISDAIISSMIGYADSSWAVRNSATMVFASTMLRVVDADKNAASNSGNAITATELFRSYPVLSTFLLRVMNMGLQGMQLDNMSASGDSSLSSSSRFLHPPLYPVLLLLSRLQPVTVSGEAAADLTEMFVPTVLECLRHRHHKVRFVAARALSNIASYESCRTSFVETLLKKCEDMLVLSEEQSDWNTVHGVLLGIQYLLPRMPDPGRTLTRKSVLHAKLRCYIESGSNTVWCPPPCASISLEILNNAAASKSNSEMDLKERVAQMSLAVVSELSEQARVTLLASRIGEARLGAIAARSYCECSVDKVWDPVVDATEREVLVENLSYLLENDAIDVRLEASKAFKKGICSDIDRVLDRSDTTRQMKKSIVLQIARMLQRGLKTELNRADKTSFNGDYNVGVHPPTVRRLSRCLIECCHALRALDIVVEMDIQTDETLSAKNMWDVSVRMLALGEEGTQGIAQLDTDRLLNGNAVELMAFALQAWFCKGTDTIATELRLFVQALRRLNDVHASWRLRHSIAVAIETSHLLLLESSSSDVMEAQLDLISELLALLQDSDPDVRFIAGRAVLQASSSVKLAKKSSSSPQLVLERAYSLIPKLFPAGEMNARILQSLFISCRGASDALHCFENETAVSEKNGSAIGLMNLGTERKIFEDEIANPFEEMILANQLRATAVVTSRATVADGDVRGLLELCSSVLGRLYARELARHSNNSSPDVAHELTWSSNTFPFIHSLIIGSIAAIYLGAEDSNDVVGDSRRIIMLLGTERESAIHPCVAQALTTLASAQPSDSDTYEALAACCFLLPTRPETTE